MESISILHISDTHLGIRQYGIVEREKDVYNVFDEAIDIALREHVDLVVHSGDVFDTTRPPAQALKQAIASLRKLREKGIPVVAILGDHDIPHRQTLPPVFVLVELREVVDFRVVGHSEPEKINIKTRHGEVVVAGIAARKGPARRQRLLEDFKNLAVLQNDKPAILMLHQTLREVTQINFDIELGELPRGYSYYAMGHIHFFKTFMIGESMVVYPGSIEIFRRDEAKQPKRYVVLAEIVKGRTLNVESIELKNTRPQLVREIGYTDSKSFEAVLAKLKLELSRYEKKPLLHVVLKNVPSTQRKNVRLLLERALQDACLAYRVEFEDIVDEESRTTAIVDASKPGSIEIAEMLKEMLGNKELADLAYKLINILGAETGQDAYEEAMRLVREAYGID